MRIDGRTDTTPPRRPRRAAALPPDERRAAIVAATVPLLMEHGTSVTTRQIAEAAAIAEGTIFRVFDDKDAVIRAAVEAVFDTAPLVEAIEAIDTTLDLEARLVIAVEFLRQRTNAIWHLVSAVGATNVPAERKPIVQERGRAELAALAALFAPEGERLRLEPLVAAQVLRGMTIAGVHPALASERQLSSAEIVSLVLDGLRVRPC